LPNFFFIDESGNTGDLVNAGIELTFGDQPIFVLIAIGVDDEAKLAEELARIRATHRIQGNELKSKRLTSRPGVALDVARFLQNRGMPVFVEVVDKRFFICATMVNHFVVPPVAGDFDQRSDVIQMKNDIAEYLHAFAPNTVLQAYISACMTPSVPATRAAFNEMRSWLEGRMSTEPNAELVMMFVRDAFDDFEEGAASGTENVNLFLPDPDLSKASKPYWMLPNLSSLTNVYGRINLYQNRQMKDVVLVHDEQVQFDRILEDGKTTMEAIARSGAAWPVRHADYGIPEGALRFSDSAHSAGIQAADVLAGFIMRFVQDVSRREKVPEREFLAAFRALSDFTNPRAATGLNYVLPTHTAQYLNLFRL
jgi:hypothetical protein